jgi:hypothetical protein
MTVKNCVICDAEFETKTNSAKLCSDKCRKLRIRERNIKRNREETYTVEYNHTCQSCNKPFTSWRSNSVFCNPTCKDDWWKGKGGNKYRADRKRKGPFELTCEVCSIEFISVKPHKKTCSEECHKIRLRPYNAKHQRESRPAILADKTSWYWEPINVIRRRIGQGIRRSLHYKDGKIAKNNTTFELLPFTKEELVEHLESQFTDGMSWDRFNEIHIDHIRPVSSFNYTTTECEDFKKCWALNNLQPLWAKDNIMKSDKWDGITNA